MTARDRVLIMGQVYGFSGFVRCSRVLLRTEGVGVVAENGL